MIGPNLGRLVLKFKFITVSSNDADRVDCESVQVFGKRNGSRITNGWTTADVIHLISVHHLRI